VPDRHTMTAYNALSIASHGKKLTHMPPKYMESITLLKVIFLQKNLVTGIFS